MRSLQLPLPPLPPTMPAVNPAAADIEKLIASLQQLDPSPSAEEDNKAPQEDLLPMMETMMQSLLSKELLYPAIKDLAERYPDWLADNRASLEDKEFERYAKKFSSHRLY